MRLKIANATHKASDIKAQFINRIYFLNKFHWRKPIRYSIYIQNWFVGTGFGPQIGLPASNRWV